MRKTNSYNTMMLHWFMTKGVNTEYLRKKYTLVFFAKLLKHIQNGLKKGNKNNIQIIFPENSFEYKTDFEYYISLLKESGFKLKIVVEDFIDEDTGEIIGIKRYLFKMSQFAN